jgi:hypothetical protein
VLPSLQVQLPSSQVLPSLQERLPSSQVLPSWQERLPSLQVLPSLPAWSSLQGRPSWPERPFSQLPLRFSLFS